MVTGVNTQENLEDKPNVGLNFAVHAYSNSRSSLKSEGDLLLQGERIVRAAITRHDEWKTVNTVHVLVGPTVAVNVYEFSKYPPRIPFPKDLNFVIKEWGAEVTEDEIFKLDELEEFVGTDFSYIVSGKGRDPIFSPATQNKRAREESPAIESDSRRRKLNLTSLYHTIPRPHIHTSRFSRSNHPPKGKPYKKTNPLFISPYTKLDFPDSTRLAWLVPIRGMLPWEGSTPAELLDIPITSSPLTSPCPVESGVKEWISWTEPSLLKFWEFLLQLRNVGSLGPLGVAFQCSNSSLHATNNTRSLSFLITSGSEEPSTLPLNLPKANLSMVDYIKVYHDARSTLHVRSAFDVWQYLCPSDDFAPKKIRVLKGARLVLLDDVSDPVLIS